MTHAEKSQATKSAGRGLWVIVGSVGSGFKSLAVESITF
jgi:hypothetical protein